jgi:hypothetical protein
MYLKAKWNETRVSPSVIAQVEVEVEDFLLSHFGSASTAFNMRAAFLQQHSPPNHPWNIGFNKAVDLAVRGISPSVKKQMSVPKISFFDE